MVSKVVTGRIGIQESQTKRTSSSVTLRQRKDSEKVRYTSQESINHEVRVRVSQSVTIYYNWDYGCSCVMRLIDSMPLF
jgi:hypothetical protein